MADKEWPQGADPAETLQGSDIIGVYQPGASGGSLNRQTTVGAVSLTPIGQRTLTSGRFDSEELVSISLAGGDWNIAQLENVAGGRATALFKIVDAGGTISFKASITMSSSAKTHANTTIEIIERSGSPLIDVVKIGKSDSVDASGALITIELTSASIITIQLLGNNGSGAGFELITPNQLTDLPDGVTAATFLEAGEELSFDTLAIVFFPDWIGYKNSNDQIMCVVNWPEIPKQGTSLVITFPSTTLLFLDGEASAGGAITGAHTISNFNIDDKHIQFAINETGIASVLNQGPLSPWVNGSGCKLTITG